MAPTTEAHAVDAINTFGVSAGHFAYLRVVSRTEIRYPLLGAISETGSIPGSSTT
jgi:hypothetical protein